METDREFASVVQLPQFGGPTLVTRRQASEDPDEGTAETVDRMQACAIEDSRTPAVWGATEQALRLAKDNSLEARCEAIYRWVAARVTFRQDEPFLRHVLGLDNELDLLIRPAALLSMRSPSEDCDGFTMLACSMLLCGGVPCEIVTIKADHDDPARFSHVYCQAILEDGRTLVMDCSQGSQHGYPIGWEAPEYFARKGWGVLQPEPQRKSMHGLEDLGACDLSGSGEDCSTASYPATKGMPFDWNAIINQAFKFGSQLALKPGQYVQNAQGVMSSNVPGAVPGQYPSTAAINVGGINTSTLLLGGAALLAVVMFSGRK